MPRWKTAALALCAVTMVAALGAAVQVHAADPEGRLSTRAYLEGYATRAAQHDALSPFLVEYAVASGLDPRTWPPAHPALPDIEVPGNGTALLLRLRPLFALAVAGEIDAEDPRTLEVLAAFDAGQFGSPDAINDDAWALRFLHAAGVAENDVRIRNATETLLGRAHEDGGWGWSSQSDSETDMTAMAILALSESGVPGDRLAAAAAFLAAASNSDGGTPLAPGAASNCDSTAWRLRSDAALGRTPDAGAQRFLSTLRNADGGFAFLPDRLSNPLCTVEVAILGVLDGVPGVVSLLTGEAGDAGSGAATVSGTSRAAPAPRGAPGPAAALLFLLILGVLAARPRRITP